MTTILIPIPRTDEATSFVAKVARYLPGNYEVTGVLPVDRGAYDEGPSVIVTGEPDTSTTMTGLPLAARSRISCS